MNACVTDPAPCSGNGVCTNGICVCQSDLFTGRSDWVNGQGHDCQILLPVIYAFWSLNLVVILVVIFLATPVLKRLFRHHSRVREHQRKKGNNYTLKENLGLLSILPFWIIALPTHTALAVYKLAQRDARLGLDLALTILWMLSRISADLSATSSRAALTTSTMQSEGKSRGAIRRREILIWTFFILSMGSSFMVWPVYASGGTDLKLAEGLFIAHFTFYAIYLWFNAYISHGLNRSVYTSLTDSYEKLKDERILQVRNDLVRSQKVERAVYFFAGLCYLILAAVPRLWTTHDYFWCVLWLIWPYIGLRSVLSLDSAQRSARGDKERDKLIAALQLTSSENADRRPSVTTPTSPSDLKQVFASKWGWAFAGSSYRLSSGGTQQ